MQNYYSHRLIKHGVVLMLIGLAGGFALIFAMIGGISLNPIPAFIEWDIPGTARGWRTLHVGSLMNGIMAIAIACGMRAVHVADDQARKVFLGTATAIWCNLAFYWFGMLAPGKGLTLQANQLGEASMSGYIAFGTGVLGAIALTYALIIILRAEEHETEA